MAPTLSQLDQVTRGTATNIATITRIAAVTLCRCSSSMVGCQPSKLNVVSSTLIARFSADACNVAQVVAQRCEIYGLTYIIMGIMGR